MTRSIGILLLACAPAALAQAPGDAKMAAMELQQVSEAARQLDAYLKAVEAAVEGFQKRPSLTAAQREELAALLKESARTREEIAELRKQLEQIGATLRAQGKDAEQLAKLVAELQAERKKLQDGPARKAEEFKRSTEPYRAFTRVEATRVGGNMGNFRMRVELERREDEKRIPLKGQLIVVYHQVKDGERTAVDRAVTDANGIAQFEFSNRNLPRDSGMIFAFPGDPEHRPSESKRITVK